MFEKIIPIIRIRLIIVWINILSSDKLYIYIYKLIFLCEYYIKNV
jgi:hypothetical protein